MGTVVLGWILIVIGLVAVIAGIGGGIAKMFQEIQAKANQGALGLPVLPTEWLKALTEFLNALVKAPIWLALVIIGLALLGWGASMI